MTLRTRLLIVLLIAACVVPAVGWLAYRVAAEALVRDASARLEAVRRVVTDAVDRDTAAWRAQAAALAEGRQTREALVEFARAVEVLQDNLRDGGLTQDDAFWTRITGELRSSYEATLFRALTVSQGKPPETGAWIPSERRSVLLQHALIAANPAPAGRKGESSGIGDLLESSDPLRSTLARTRYAAAMQRHRPGWELLAQRGPLVDVCLVDASGYVLASLRHTMILGQNLRAPQHQASAPARAFRAAMLAEGPTTRRVVIQDAAPSEWDGGEPSYWLSCSVEDDLSRCIGAVLLRVPASRLTQLATFRGREAQVGLGATGASVIVGADGLLRTEHRVASRLAPATLRTVSSADGSTSERTAVMAVNLSSHPAVRALGRTLDPTGNAGVVETIDDKGEPVLCAYGPVRADDLGWGTLVWITRAEGLAAATALRNVMLYTLGGVLLAGVAAAWLIAGSISRPLSELAAAATKIGQGDESLRVPVHSPRSEVGRVALAVNSMLTSLAAGRAAKENAHRELREDVDSIVEVTKAMGSGDLRVRATVTRGAVGIVAAHLNMALESIGEVVGETQMVASGTRDNAAHMARAQSAAAALASESSVTAVETNGAVAEVLGSAEKTAVVASTFADGALHMEETAEDNGVGMELLAKNLGELVELGRRTTNELKEAAEESMGADQKNAQLEEVARAILAHALNLRLVADSMRVDDPKREGLQHVASEIQASGDELLRATGEEGARITSVLKAMQGAVRAGEETAQALLTHADHARATKTAFGDLQRQIHEAAANLRQIAEQASAQQDILRRAAAGSSQTARQAQDVAAMGLQAASDAEQLAEGARHLAESAGSFQVFQRASPDASHHSAPTPLEPPQLVTA